jgi:phage shock protein A
MGIISRISTILKAKANSALDKAEDPRETLDYSYEKQLEMLRNVKKGIVEVVTAKKRIELQAATLKNTVDKLDGQARQAIAAGREDLARMALERKQLSLTQLQGLQTQIGDLEAEQQKLTTAEQRLSAKIESFRTRKEVVKAQYAAAEAQVKIGESLTGLSEEMADVGMAIDRAEDKTAKLRARSTAIDDLIESGTLDDFSGGKGDVLDRELAKASATSGIELELAQMKAQLASGDAPKQLPGGTSGSTQ